MTEPTPPLPFAEDADIGNRFARMGAAPGSDFFEGLSQSGLVFSLDKHVRAESSRDWWPLGLSWSLRGMVGMLADVVVRPRSTDEVSTALRLCQKFGVTVTSAGGRSGVSGGSIPLAGGVLLDLTDLDEIFIVDEESLTLRVSSGFFGPELDERLRATGSGYTLGHWPQSFDLSTVGGWLACRGAGQYSTRYGKIEDMVRGLEVVLADGRVLRTDGGGPRSATGPNLTQLFVGSEGTLGVITEATLVLHPLPPNERRGAWSFPTFDAGMDACRRILRRGATPAVLRLYDQIESERHFGLASNVLIVLDEADPLLLDATMRIVNEEVEGATELDAQLVGTWLEKRNDVSQLAPLWEKNVVVDTIEMAGPWSQLSPLRERVLDVLRSVEGTVVASVHQSHAYLDGACLYVTFAGLPPEPGLDGIEAYYRTCWDRATKEILSHSAAISHHHGIGLNRGRYLADALGESFEVLSSVKTALDPDGRLNPGKLGLGESEMW